MKAFATCRINSYMGPIEYNFAEIDNQDQNHYNGKDVCLTWALKGSCTSKCKGSGAHFTYPATVNKKFHALLDGSWVDPHGG